MIRNNVLKNREVMKPWHSIKTEQFDSALKTLAAQIAKNNGISEIDKIHVYHTKGYCHLSGVFLTIYPKSKNENPFRTSTTYCYVDSDSYFYIFSADRSSCSYYDNLHFFIIGDSVIEVESVCNKSISDIVECYVEPELVFDKFVYIALMKLTKEDITSFELNY